MAANMTRGPLPASIYWRRRLFVIGTVLALILIAVNLIGGGDDSPEQGTAQQSAADTGSDSDESTMTEAEARAQRKAMRRQARQAKRIAGTPGAPVLPQPSGECDPSDLIATPSVTDAIAGQDVAITVAMQTKTSPACTFTFSSDSVAVKVTSDGEDVWSSVQCAGALSDQPIVVRSAQATPVTVTWTARRSSAGCPKFTPWAQPGDYQVATAAYGGEPADADFELVLPKSQVLPPVETGRKGAKSRGDGDAEKHSDTPKVR